VESRASTQCTHSGADTFASLIDTPSNNDTTHFSEMDYNGNQSNVHSFSPGLNVIAELSSPSLAATPAFSNFSFIHPLLLMQTFLEFDSGYQINPRSYQEECFAAAKSSGIPPTKLLCAERCLVRNPTEIKCYINIRNSLLRLWMSYPSIKVSLKRVHDYLVAVY
jgi:hypothetical protein